MRDHDRRNFLWWITGLGQGRFLWRRPLTGGNNPEFAYDGNTYRFIFIALETDGSLSIEFKQNRTGDIANKATRDKLEFRVDGQAFNLGEGDYDSSTRIVKWTGSGPSWTTGGTVALAFVEAADATLSDLSLSRGTLSPAFDAATTAYTASVVYDVTSITVTPTANDANATVAYFDENDAALADAGSRFGHQVSLSVGENTIKVKVTAGDGGTTETYTVVVTRGGATRP